MEPSPPPVTRAPAAPNLLKPFLLAAALCAAASPRAADTLDVGVGARFARLADALAASREGDVITVAPGTYADTGLKVDRKVSIEGRGWPVFDARGGCTLLDIRASGVTISGLVLRGVGTNYLKECGGIWIDRVDDVSIIGNRFEKDFFGVYAAQARRARIEGNTFSGLGGRESANGNGVHFWKGDSAVIKGNTIVGHRDGIYLEFTGNTHVEGNTCEGNVRYGLHFMYANGNRYLGNLFSRNGSGVAVMYSNGVDMRGNTFRENWGGASYGLLLKSIKRSRIEGNTFDRNTVAVFQEASSKVEMIGNAFRSNGWALRIVADCDANQYRGNRFEGNTFDVAYNASPASTNVFAGNAWDHYRGYDLDRNGIGDVPHRPVELFPTLMHQHPQAMVLLRSHFVSLLNALERMFPTLSPATLQDESPLMPGPGRSPGKEKS